MGGIGGNKGDIWGRCVWLVLKRVFGTTTRIGSMRLFQRDTSLEKKRVAFDLLHRAFRP